VTLEHRANEGVVSISGGGSSFSLNCFQAQDFPELPPDEGQGLLVPADLFVDTVERVARAASRDETRPVLTGVLLRLAPDGMTMVATDSYRLAVRQTPLDAPPPEASEAIVPARAVGEAARLPPPRRPRRSRWS
jgi:DNA polymerase-3 subunit beta